MSLLLSQTLTQTTLAPFPLGPSPPPKPALLRFPRRRSAAPILRSSPDAGAVLVADLVEKDFSFLEPDNKNNDLARIIAASAVEPESKVLAVLPTVAFVDRLVELAPCELFVAIHESLLVLALIKEGHDAVRCWQGGVDVVPKKFGDFDVVFVCYFPGMGVGVGELLRLVGQRCSKGARVSLSFDQGGEAVQRHRQQYPDVATSDLPDRIALEKAAKEQSFQITEFSDEPNFYLAVLKYDG